MNIHLRVELPMAALGLALAPFFGLPAVLAVAGSALALHAWGVVHPRSGLYLPVVWRLPAGTSDTLALTFDDGPHPEVTPRLLDQLAAHRQHATFFVIGQHVRQHPALIRRMLAEGHGLGLHSDTHSRLFNLWPTARVEADLLACGAAIADATGAAAPRLFRPPVGLKNPLVGYAVRRLGLTTVTWSGRGFDAFGASPARVIARLRPRLRARAILALHDGHEPGRPRDRRSCLTVVADLLPRLAELGLRSVGMAADEGGVGVRVLGVGPTPNG